MIVFNRPACTGNEEKHVLQALASGKLSGDGLFGQKCHEWFEHSLNCSKALLTPSCTAALEIAALLLGVQPGDEVIMPSYTFVSTANAFVLRGARIVFVDVHPDTMNINEDLVEAAITKKTKIIVAVHYAGVACNMDAIMALANRHSLYVVEDAAQAILSTFRGKKLGTIGHVGTFSFHETKNITSGGEGGLLIINDPSLSERAEIFREKGTNRNKFFRGQVDKYTWVDIGGSHLPSELQAAYLWGQIEVIDSISQKRMEQWNHYDLRFRSILSYFKIQLPNPPDICQQNGHIYFLKLPSLAMRSSFIEQMRLNFGVMCVFHYVPLHSSPAGQQFGRFHGDDVFTTSESEKLVRLPIWHQLDLSDVDYICDSAEKVLMSLK